MTEVNHIMPATNLKDPSDDFIGNRVVIRADRAGVFFGTLISCEQDTTILENVRRIWYWDGAASLSQLAEEGVSKPQGCKFPCLIKKMRIFGVIEIINTSRKCQQSIDNVQIWKES